MGALESNTTNIFGIHLRESADDGSDFSNAAADYRVLFIGEDGFLHAKDSAGTVTDPYDTSGTGIPDTLLDAKGDLIVASAADTAARMAAGADGTILRAYSAETNGLVWDALAFAEYTRTSANYSTNSTSFVDVDGTNLALTITTRAVRVRVGLVGTMLTAAVANAQVSFDIDIDGSRVGGTDGMVAGRNANDTTQRFYNASFVYLTDVLSAASHTFKLQWKTSAGTASLQGDSTGRTMRFYVEETLITT